MKKQILTLVTLFILSFNSLLPSQDPIFDSLRKYRELNWYFDVVAEYTKNSSQKIEARRIAKQVFENQGDFTDKITSKPHVNGYFYSKYIKKIASPEVNSQALSCEQTDALEKHASNAGYSFEDYRIYRYIKEVEEGHTRCVNGQLPWLDMDCDEFLVESHRLLENYKAEKLIN